jgi:eukaryotic-like serine/threonine-protein kinase
VHPQPRLSELSRSPYRGLAPSLAERLAASGYELLAHLHRSNGFDVYDAWSVERRCRCVVKVPRPDRSDDQVLLRRLEREGRLLYGLSHPHIVRGYELLPAPFPAVVTETLRGETLSHLLDARRLSAAEASVLGLQLCSALAYLHANGHLHLDLKPSNIVVDAGRAIVIDLSVARPPGDAPRGLGTWCYLAPEQVHGAALDAAADVWGVGVVLFEAVARRPAFGNDDEEDDDPEQADYPQLEVRASPIRTLRRVPAALADAIDACLDPDPWRRPTLDELAARLQTVPGVGSPRAVRS